MTKEPTAWAHMPNAKHIDWVLDSLHTNPKRWDAARDAAWTAARAAAWDTARSARSAARAAWDAARAARAARAAVRDAAWAAAWAAIAALIAWDESSDLLSMDPDAVKLLADCGNHAAILLYPAVLVRNQT